MENINIEYKEYPHICACCNEGTIEDVHDICLVCGWEDDEVQNNDNEFAGGANKDSLIEHRMKFLKLRDKKKNYMWCNTLKNKAYKKICITVAESLQKIEKSKK